MADRFEEVLRFIIKTTGDEALRSLAQEILEIGKVSEESEEQVKGFVDELGDVEKARRTIKTYADLRAELELTQASLAEAKTGAAALFKEFKDGDASSKQVARAMRDARKAIAELEEAERKQQLQLQKLRGDLRAVGVDYRALGTAQGQLADRSAAAAKGLRDVGAAVRSARADQATLTARLREGDEAFRRQAASSRASADALRTYRQRAQESAKANRDLVSTGSATVGLMGRLRGALVGLGAFLSFRAAVDGVANLLKLGDAAESTRRRLAGLFGSRDAGNKAFAALRTISRDNAQSFDAMLEAATRLKSFGLDPLDGTLQALIDQNARLGGSQETLQGIILAVGQAYAKQKLQGEEILQLVERGVPVWDLLAKATGKNVVELQKLSEQGKLGRDTIRLLLAEIGKASSGAAAANVNSLTAQFAGLVDRVKEFFRQVADSGALTFFKEQIAGLSRQIDELAANGKLVLFAKRFSDAIIGVTTAIRDGVTAIVRYKDQIVLLAEAYVAIKFLSIITSIQKTAKAWIAADVAAKAYTATAATSAASTGAIATAATGLTAVLGRVGKLMRAALPVVLLTAFIDQIVALKSALSDLAAEEEAAAAARSRAADAQGQLNQRLAAYKQLFAEDAKQAIATADELKAKSEAEAQAYLHRIENARSYFQALAIEAQRAGDEVGFQEATKRVTELGAAVAAAKDQIVAAAKATQAAIDSIGQFGADAAAKFDAIRQAGTAAEKAVSGIFKGVDLSSAAGLTKAADAITAIAARGSEAATAIRTELRAELAKLSDQDFAKVASMAKQAFAAGVDGARELSEAVGKVSLERLGVDVDRIKSGFTAAGRAAVDAFKLAAAEVSNLGLTAKQESEAVAQAFTGALAKAQTKAEITELGRALQDAFKEGKVSAADFASVLPELTAKLAQAGAEGGKGFADGVGAGAKRAQRELLATLETLRSEVAGKAQAIAAELGRALQAGASPEVIRPLREEYAALDAQLKSLNGQVTATGQALQESGSQGAQAGQVTADAANRATQALQETGEAGKQAGADTAEGAQEAGTGVNYLADLINRLIEKYAAVSEGAKDFFVEALKSAGRGAQTFQQLGEAIERADRATIQALANQAQQAKGIQQNLAAFAATGEDAFERIGASGERAVAILQGVIDGAREARAGFELLDQTGLQNLIASAEAARAKLQQLADAQRSAREQLEAQNRAAQDEADRASGNDTAVAERALQERLAEIKRLREQGGREAQLAADQAEALARAAHQRELQRIRERQDADRGASDARIENDERERAAREGTGQIANPNTAGTQGQQAAGPVVNIHLDDATIMGTLDRAALENFARNLQPELNRLAALRR